MNLTNIVSTIDQFSSYNTKEVNKLQKKFKVSIMKKVMGSILLGSMLFISTGCVSETLGLSSKDNANNADATAYQKKETELATKLDDRTEKRVDGFFEKMLNKVGL
jgi:hypothetical protein